MDTHVLHGWRQLEEEYSLRTPVVERLSLRIPGSSRRLTSVVIDYLDAQIKAGVHIVQVFEACVNTLTKKFVKYAHLLGANDQN